MKAAGGRAATGTWPSRDFVVTLTALVVVALVAISGRSLWIDEACTAMKAIQPTLAGWWQTLVHEKIADVQMPLYMLCVWGWARVFGSGEWSLHLANLPWFVAGAAVFIFSFPAGNSSRRIAALLVLVCPFAWYYLDEARPYATQLGAGLLIVGSLRRLQQVCGRADTSPRMALASFLVGIVVLSGSSLLGMVWAGAAVVALGLLLPKAQIGDLLRREWGLCLMGAVPLVALAMYYLWSLKAGARASAAATTTVGSAFFAIYELLGFGGLGPGRLEMRSAGPAALRGHLFGIVLYAVVTSLVAGTALVAVFGSRNRKHIALALCCAVPPAFILGVGWIAHFRVLGRHLAPFVPVWLLLLTFGTAALWARRSVLARTIVVIFCVLSLFSCLSLRFAPRHEKDNYRAAAALARTALREGRPVWWSAAEEGARYYGVPLGQTGGTPGEAVFVMNPTRQALDAMTTPQLIVSSKPDIYDAQLALANYIHDRGFSPARDFTAFVIWEKNAN
jgi:hypothetical protein